MKKSEALQDNWVGIRRLIEEFEVKEGTITRWAKQGLVRRMAVDHGSTKWLYDIKYFKKAFGSLRIMDHKIKMNAYKKYSRKLAAIEGEIELGAR